MAETEQKASSPKALECLSIFWEWTDDVSSHIHNPTVILRDNEIAIKLATNLVFHARTGHIENKHHFISERVLDGTIDMKVLRNKNITDLL